MEEMLGVTVTEISYKKRLTYALIILICTITIFIIWWMGLGVHGSSEKYFLPFVVLGCGLIWSWSTYHKKELIVYEKHMVNSTDERGRPIKVELLTANGAAALALMEETKMNKASEEMKPFDDFVESIWGRLLIAIFIGGIAYWVYFENPEKVLLPSLLAFGAVCCVFDLMLWIVGIGLVIGITVWLGGAIASLSIPLAIIIGALIIAGAMRK